MCLACEKGVKALDEAQLAQEETAKGQERLGQLVGVDPGDLVAAVEQQSWSNNKASGGDVNLAEVGGGPRWPALSVPRSSPLPARSCPCSSPPCPSQHKPLS